ncbi:MAG: VCBS repeat-containing protein, partial [Myxococcota bacterium]
MLSCLTAPAGPWVRVGLLACLSAACSTETVTPEPDAGPGDAGPVDEGTPTPDLGPEDSFVPCPEPSSACVTVVRQDGECVEEAVEDGTACDDGSLCTTDDFCDEGICGGTAVECPDEILCQTDPVCDPATGICAGTPVDDGTVCSDGNLCTRGDTCQAGACLGAVRPDGWACDDFNGCTNLDICQDGVCVGTRPLPEGARCEDGDLCTYDDICTDGECVGRPSECGSTERGACLTEYCDPATGFCRFDYAPDGTPCDDDNTCTSGDTCLFGGCSGTPSVPAAGACAGPFCFRDGTVAAGFEGANMNAGGDVGGGAAIFDPDEDGDMDVLFVTDRYGSSARPDPQGYLHYFENDGTGAFTESTIKAFGVADTDTTGPQGVLVADLDGDGHDDVYIYGRGDNFVFEGAGDGTFTDVTATSGLAGGDVWTTAATVADFDGDGDLDLYEGNYIREFMGPTHIPEPNRFYRNDGTGTFTNVSAEFPVLVGGEDLTLSVLFTDVDGDGDEDLMVCNDFGAFRDPNKLFRNEGDGTFTDISVAANFRDGFFCMSIAPGDYDR